MATFKTFEEIDAWKKARELTKRIYAVSGAGTFAKDFSLKDQIRRASVSIMSNIAEGYDRSGTGEFVQFLAMQRDRLLRSRASCTLRWIKTTSTRGCLPS